jgi:peptidyl-prolyl cis-trans isomerase D
LVTVFSDDNGKTKPADKADGDYYIGKGGDYGWLNANSGFVPEFKNAGLDGKKGDLTIVESQYGYHIIEVLDSKGAIAKVQVATIERTQKPSNKTLQTIYAEATAFAGKNTTYDQFKQAVIDNNLNKREALNVKENEKQIAGIESPKNLIRWMYENEKGTVSEPKEFGSRYIVAVISDVKEKGFASLDDVKETVIAAVINEKKAELFVKKFNDATAGNASFEKLISKTGITPQPATNINFNTGSIQMIGNEPAIVGVAAVQKENSMSKPLIGKSGVFVCYTTKVYNAPTQTDFTFLQAMELNKIQPRSDYEVYGALKDNAHIQDHLVRFY